jgi:predicted MFS family arabinose efflux permease
MSAPAVGSRITGSLVALFAVACGISAANLYYAQPLLPQISRDLHVGSGSAALVITAAQVGYGLGLALIVPLGDIIIRRRLVPAILVIAAAALFAASVAPDITVLIAAVAVAGLCSVAAQILVPFAASLASDHQRGRVLGTVMSGLLLGILLARTFSGLIAEAGGWRTVYVVAGGVVLALSAVLQRRLPGEERRPAIAYSELLGSAVHLMRTEPLLRLRSAIGGLAFATFNVMWTSLAFLLVGSPYHYSEAVIGLFGLLGAAGALAASFSGRLADRGLERWVTGGSLVIAVGAMGLLAVGAHQLWALIAGIVLGDLGIQAVHIQNQQLIFGIEASARSRLNTGYMVTYFVGGAIGSATTGLAYGADGWSGVVALGLGYSGAGLALWVVSEVARGHRRSAGRPAPQSTRPPSPS